MKSDIGELKPLPKKTLSLIGNVLFLFLAIYFILAMFFQIDPLSFVSGPAAYTIR